MILTRQKWTFILHWKYCWKRWNKEWREEKRRKAQEESKICIFFALSPKKCQWFKDFPYRKYSYAQFQWNGIVIERQNVSHQIWTRRAAHKQCEMNGEYTDKNCTQAHLKPLCNWGFFIAKKLMIRRGILCIRWWEWGDGSEQSHKLKMTWAA